MRAPQALKLESLHGSRAEFLSLWHGEALQRIHTNTVYSIFIVFKLGGISGVTLFVVLSHGLSFRKRFLASV